MSTDDGEPPVPEPLPDDTVTIGGCAEVGDNITGVRVSSNGVDG